MGLVYSFVRLITPTLKKLYFKISFANVRLLRRQKQNRSDRFQGDEKKGEPWNEVGSWIHLRCV